MPGDGELSLKFTQGKFIRAYLLNFEPIQIRIKPTAAAAAAAAGQRGEINN
jgi:hypothetical protein